MRNGTKSIYFETKLSLCLEQIYSFLYFKIKLKLRRGEIRVADFKSL